MRALVTGGSGFIGSNVVRKLNEEGYAVRVLDNLSSGYIENIKNFISFDQIEYIAGDVRDYAAVERAMEKVDVVFHLAASVGRQRSIDNPQADSDINLIGTINVLEAMWRKGAHKIVYSSSASIFGEPKYPTISESHTQEADSPYGVSKLAAEKMILAYCGIYDISAVCLRYFNIYGINQRYDVYGNVIPIFAKKIYCNEPLIIYGDGNQTRDFVNVLDVARANLLSSKTQRKTDVFNVGSGESITINRLAGIMQEISGRNVGVKYEPERPADVKHCKADATKIKTELGFEIQISLREGLEEYLKWYKDNCM